jgi:protein-tyrosine-phosphatase
MTPTDNPSTSRPAFAIPDIDQHMNRITDELAHRYSGTYSRETVRVIVEESYGLLAAHASIPTFLPVLTQKFARQRMEAMAVADGQVLKATPEVLFICVHNAGRSQMAAAWLDHFSAGQVRVRSAGSAPTREINPTVSQAMAEVGIELTEAFPKPMTDDILRASDVIITMGCGDACPIFPGKRYLDWDLPDPAGQPIEQVRVIRDDIQQRVHALLTDLMKP